MSNAHKKTITVRYFALFRELAGRSEESIETSAGTASEVFDQLGDRHGFGEPAGHCKVAINDRMADWSSKIRDGDSVLLFPPVAGG